MEEEEEAIGPGRTDQNSISHGSMGESIECKCRQRYSRSIKRRIASIRSLMNTEGDQMPRRILIVRPWYFEQVLG